jgi:acetyl-CoA carboxylase biotin carboxyl carrier protein
MSRTAPDAAQLLQQLTATARQLAGEVPGPLRQLTVALDDARIELTWEDSPREGRDVPRTDSVLVLARPPADELQEPEEAAGTVVRSPIVGTFYRAQAPGEPPFVAIGGAVDPDTVVGIVEAMKLMNHITAGQCGVVRSVLVPDGSPVEFDQPLVVLDPPADWDGSDPNGGDR